jgi:serine/threonine-protein kinase
MVGIIIGNYQITDELAHGSLGMVYRGVHVNLAREVVVREVSLSRFPISTRVQLKARFRRETFIQAQLDHPGIVRLYEAFAKGDNYYLVMEYVQGVSLRDLLLRQGLPTAAQALYLCKQALAALDYSHNFQYLTESDVQRKGVFHRDLKPANLLIDGRGRLKITDFGIVKMPDKQSLAPPSFRPGTSEYMPPEQLRGLDQDARSDIYSLGVTFYEMLTGQLPFSRTARSLDDDLQFNAPDPAPMSISEIRSDMPLSLSSIFMRAIVRNSSERFQTAAEFLKAIKEYERSSGATEVPSGPLVPRLTSEQPEAATIIEIAAKPEKLPPAQPQTAPIIPSLKTPAPLVEGSINQPQLLRETKTDSLAGRSAESMAAARRAPSQSLALNGSQAKESNAMDFFDNIEDSPHKARRFLIAAATAASLLTLLTVAYYLMRGQSGSEIGAQRLESPATANVASAVPAVSAATPQPEPSPAPANIGDLAKLQRAREADRAGKFNQAADLYADYLRSAPADAESAAVASQLEKLRKFIVYLNSARGAYNRGDYFAARLNYAEALKLRPYSRTVQNGLARSQARLSGASPGPSSEESRPPQN